MQYFYSLAFLSHCSIGLGKRTQHLRGPFIGTPVLIGDNMLDPAFTDFFRNWDLPDVGTSFARRIIISVSPLASTPSEQPENNKS